MSEGIIILAATAAAIGFIHTVTGPDHYIPFIALSKLRGWNMAKTSLVTILCGLGHVLSSVILGFVGVILGAGIFKLKLIEAYRGEIATWLLIVFGFIYFIWGINKARHWQPPASLHSHQDTGWHLHKYKQGHSHSHNLDAAKMTPWILFIIFAFGPCEPLIPLIMYPAAKYNMLVVILVAFIFSLVTIFSMLGIVLISSYGLSKLPLHQLERHSHALAGLAIFLCGLAIKFLRL